MTIPLQEAIPIVGEALSSFRGVTDFDVQDEMVQVSAIAVHGAITLAAHELIEHSAEVTYLVDDILPAGSRSWRDQKADVGQSRCRNVYLTNL